jgi:hypothetical protein
VAIALELESVQNMSFYTRKLQGARNGLYSISVRTHASSACTHACTMRQTYATRARQRSGTRGTNGGEAREHEPLRLATCVR